jgi:hypothetical protein
MVACAGMLSWLLAVGGMAAGAVAIAKGFRLFKSY